MVLAADKLININVAGDIVLVEAVLKELVVVHVIILTVGGPVDLRG